MLTHFACLNSVLNVKALVWAFNQEESLVGAFSVIVKTDGSFAAVVIEQLPGVRSRSTKEDAFSGTLLTRVQARGALVTSS